MNDSRRDEMARQYHDAFGDVEDAWGNRYDDRTVYPEENGEHGDGLTPEELAEHLAFPAPWEDKNERDDGNDAAELNAERQDYLEWSAEREAHQAALEKAHAHAEGAICTNDGAGTCSICHVALVECEICAGVGYHRASCFE